ncbi:DUF6339 family protein [Methylophilaceae bacterium]|nr:DUF6339 family protein [Methylophilaceae bacterium]
MMHEYYTLPAEKGYQFIKKLQNGEEIDISKDQVKKGEGQLYPEEELEILSNRIFDEMKTKREIASSTEKEFVEASAAKWFKEIVTVDNKAFVDPEFWLWLSIKHFYKFIEWRYREDNDKSVSIANYGLRSENACNITENLLYGIWIRGKQSHNKNLSDPYTYTTKTNSIDLYKSFIIRRNWAGIKKLAYTFIKKKYEKKLNTFQHRALGRDIQAIHANLALEIFTEDELDNLMTDRLPKIKEESEQNV